MCVTPDFCTSHSESSDPEPCSTAQAVHSGGHHVILTWTCSVSCCVATAVMEGGRRTHCNVWDFLQELLVPPSLVTAVPAKTCRLKGQLSRHRYLHAGYRRVLVSLLKSQPAPLKFILMHCIWLY